MATTVIEVGVDVPNATVMVIEHADRFGLAQLHQLRGRIGRGKEKSHCILVAPKTITGEARERIETMVATSNGFEIAERDLKLRGPGEFFGTRQHGDAAFAFAQPLRDHELLEFARREAFALAENPARADEVVAQAGIAQPGVAETLSTGVGWMTGPTPRRTRRQDEAVRVIAGKFRSRKLKGPGKLRLRPTSDRLRETLFNILGPAVEDSLFVDLYAGTGAIGIEAISRGAREVIFVESHMPRARGWCAPISRRLEFATGVEVIEAEAVRRPGTNCGAAPRRGLHFSRPSVRRRGGAPERPRIPRCFASGRAAVVW